VDCTDSTDLRKVALSERGSDGHSKAAEMLIRRICPRTGTWTCTTYDQRDLGSTRLTAASSARSLGLSLDRVLCRRSTASLVAQDDDLKILGSVTASEQREQLDGAAQRQVGEFGQHQGWPPRGHKRLSIERQFGGNSSSEATPDFVHPSGGRGRRRPGRSHRAARL
jgi:hypothetical protein